MQNEVTPTPHVLFDIHTMPMSIDQQILATLKRIEVLLTPFKPEPVRQPLHPSREELAAEASKPKGKFGRK